MWKLGGVNLTWMVQWGGGAGVGRYPLVAHN